MTSILKNSIRAKVSINFVGQLVRYCLVGVLVYASDFCVFILIVFWDGTIYQEANIAGRIVGAVLGFILHKKYTFSDLQQSDGVYRQLIGYLALFGSNAILSALFLWVAVDFLSLNVLLSRLLVDVLIVAFSFFVSRFLIFKGEKSGP